MGDMFGKKIKKKRSHRERSASTDRRIQELQEELPKEIDEYTTLVKVEKGHGDGVDFWYEVNDEGTRMCRKYGRPKLREAADKVVDQSTEAQEFAEDGMTVHHIYESKFGTHLMSFTVSPESLEDKETIGKPQTNPFTVTTVSRKGDQETTEDEK